MEDVGLFYGQLVHFTVFWYILWTFGIVRGNLVYFSRFGILYQEKFGNPGFKSFLERANLEPESIDIHLKLCETLSEDFVVKIFVSTLLETNCSSVHAYIKFYKPFSLLCSMNR
jgi:hypothetical protein